MELKGPRKLGTNGPSLREYIEALFDAHKEAHKDHKEAHDNEHDFAQRAINTSAELAKENKSDANEWRAAMNDRERTFATKVDTKNNSDRLDKLEDIDIKRTENERLRLIREAEIRSEESRRASRQQWLISTVTAAMAVLVSILIRLLDLFR